MAMVTATARMMVVVAVVVAMVLEGCPWESRRGAPGGGETVRSFCLFALQLFMCFFYVPVVNNSSLSYVQSNP